MGNCAIANRDQYQILQRARFAKPQITFQDKFDFQNHNECHSITPDAFGGFTESKSSLDRYGCHVTTSATTESIRVDVDASTVQNFYSVIEVAEGVFAFLLRSEFGRLCCVSKMSKIHALNAQAVGDQFKIITIAFSSTTFQNQLFQSCLQNACSVEFKHSILVKNSWIEMVTKKSHSCSNLHLGRVTKPAFEWLSHTCLGNRFSSLLHFSLGSIGFSDSNCNDSALMVILRCTGKTLLTLKLRKLNSLSIQTMAFIGLHCVRLHTLHVISCNGIRIQSMTKFGICCFKRCLAAVGPTMTSLDIRYSFEVSDDVISHIALSLRRDHVKVVLLSRTESHEKGGERHSAKSRVDGGCGMPSVYVPDTFSQSPLTQRGWDEFVRRLETASLLFIDNVESWPLVHVRPLAPPSGEIASSVNARGPGRVLDKTLDDLFPSAPLVKGVMPHTLARYGAESKVGEEPCCHGASSPRPLKSTTGGKWSMMMPLLPFSCWTASADEATSGARKGDEQEDGDRAGADVEYSQVSDVDTKYRVRRPPSNARTCPIHHSSTPTWIKFESDIC